MFSYVVEFQPPGGYSKATNIFKIIILGNAAHHSSSWSPMDAHTENWLNSFYEPMANELCVCKVGI